MNPWGIPSWLEKEVGKRDKGCVYCGVQMIEKMPPSGPRNAVATWEHIINDASIVTRENIARCCFACNSSKGTNLYPPECYQILGPQGVMNWNHGRYRGLQN